MHTLNHHAEKHITQENQEFRVVGGAVTATPLEKEIIITSDEYYYCLLAQDKLHRWASINNLLDAQCISFFYRLYARN